MPEKKTKNCIVCNEPIGRKATRCPVHKQNGPHIKPIADRLWSKVKKTEYCWIWTGSLDGRGYGQIGYGSSKDGTRTLKRAHRIAWEVTHGEIPDGLFACHKCDNKLCCNPSHLFLGTCQDNCDDKMSKDRGLYGERMYNHKLTDEDVREIRKLHQSAKINFSKIGREYNVSSRAIQAAATGRTWKHVK